MGRALEIHIFKQADDFQSLVDAEFVVVARTPQGPGLAITCVVNATALLTTGPVDSDLAVIRSTRKSAGECLLRHSMAAGRSILRPRAACPGRRCSQRPDSNRCLHAAVASGQRFEPVDRPAIKAVTISITPTMRSAWIATKVSLSASQRTSQVTINSTPSTCRIFIRSVRLLSQAVPQRYGAAGVLIGCQCAPHPRVGRRVHLAAGTVLSLIP